MVSHVKEQRANSKFCFKMGKTATETFQLIKQAYGDNGLSCTWSLVVCKISGWQQKPQR
jgi:hypothetical protein